MNPQFRTVAIIAASLGLLLSLFVALRATGDDETASPPTTATTAEPAPPPTTAPGTTAPAPTATTGFSTVRIDYVISGGRPVGGIARDSVEQGRIVVLRVTSDVADEVHVHGYDLKADVVPGKPATIRFTADTPGLFEIELEELGVQIAELKVRP